jgi:hypothetical protein
VLATASLPSGSPSDAAHAPLTTTTTTTSTSAHGKRSNAAAATAAAAAANNKQWLVEWGAHWATARHSPAGVAYRNSRMFGVADVHADTVSAYKLFGADLARAGASVASAAASATHDAAARLQAKHAAPGPASETANAAAAAATAAAAAAASAGAFGVFAGSPPASPPPPKSPRSPSALDRAALASAERGATSRGHSTFARLLAARQATAAAADEADFALAPPPSAVSALGPEDDGDDDVGDEDGALLSV